MSIPILPAVGFLRSVSGARFLGGFTTPTGKHYIIAGAFANSVPAFRSSTAMLSYEKPEDLIGTKTIHGVVGREDMVSLQLGNHEGDEGVTIEAKLDMPIHPVTSVCGSVSFNET